MSVEIDDGTWERANEKEWHVIQKSLHDLLVSKAGLDQADFEISAVRSNPSTVEVLLFSRHISTKTRITRHLEDMQKILLGHADH